MIAYPQLAKAVGNQSNDVHMVVYVRPANHVVDRKYVCMTAYARPAKSVGEAIYVLTVVSGSNARTATAAAFASMAADALYAGTAVALLSVRTASYAAIANRAADVTSANMVSTAEIALIVMVELYALEIDRLTITCVQSKAIESMTTFAPIVLHIYFRKILELHGSRRRKTNENAAFLICCRPMTFHMIARRLSTSAV
jgi:hypothetical protein